MIPIVGAPAIAKALRRDVSTVYGWARDQRRGRPAPVLIRKDAGGRLFITTDDVERFFFPPVPRESKTRRLVLKHLAGLDRKLLAFERR